MSTTPHTTTSKGEKSFAALSPAALPPAQPVAQPQPTIAELRQSIRTLPCMSPNAVCHAYHSDRSILIVCGPLHPEADFDAACDEADKLLDAAGLNNTMREFVDLHGAHLVIDAEAQDHPQE